MNIVLNASNAMRRTMFENTNHYTFFNDISDFKAFILIFVNLQQFFSFFKIFKINNG